LPCPFSGCQCCSNTDNATNNDGKGGNDEGGNDDNNDNHNCDNDNDNYNKSSCTAASSKPTQTAAACAHTAAKSVRSILAPWLAWKQSHASSSKPASATPSPNLAFDTSNGKRRSTKSAFVAFRRASFWSRGQ